jgi:hypothetical protein
MDLPFANQRWDACASPEPGSRPTGSAGLPYRDIEEKGQIVPVEVEDSPMGMIELPDEAEIDRVQPIASTNRAAVHLLGEGLARLVMDDQPISGSGAGGGSARGRSLRSSSR